MAQKKSLLPSVGKKIRQARLEQSLTQEDLAKVLAISIKTIYRYENGLTSPINRIDDIARALSKPIEFFLDDFVEFPSLKTNRNPFYPIPFLTTLSKGIVRGISDSNKTHACPDWLFHKYKGTLFALKLKMIKNKTLQLDKSNIGIFTTLQDGSYKLVKERRTWKIKKSNTGTASLLRLERNFVE